MKKLLFVFAAILAIFTIVACDSKTTAPTTEAPAEEVVFNWNIGADPKTLDPGLNGASDGGDVINNTFEGLVREKNGEILPGMAESWTVSSDGLTVTFNMRDDAKWSDGTALDADDFVRSWLRGMDPRNASEYSWIWEYTNVVGAADFANGTPEYYEYNEATEEDELKSEYAGWTEAQMETNTNTVLDTLADAVGIESLDDGDTFKVTLSAPTNWFVSLMAFYHFMPVPADSPVTNDGAWAKDPTKAISNGPFTLKSYTVNDMLVLEKNENYWNAENVGIDVINGYFIDLATTAYARYYAGELDFLGDVPSDLIPSLSVASDEFYVFPLLGTYYINFNLSGDPDLGGTRDVGDRDLEVFYNLKLRQALALSIDRVALTEALGAGQVPAAGFIPPGFMDDQEEDFYETSKDASIIVIDDSKYANAVTLFEEAADELFPDAATTAAAVALLQAELETKQYAYNTSEGHQQIGELVQGMWEENLGFTIELTNEEWALFQDTRTAGDFDMARGGWLTDFMDPSGMLGIFTPGNAYNDPDYNNPDFVDAMNDANTATTAAAHFAALYEAHEIFMGDMPIIPLYHYNDVLMIKSYVKGWARSVLGSIDFSTAYFEE